MKSCIMLFPPLSSVFSFTLIVFIGYAVIYYIKIFLYHFVKNYNIEISYNEQAEEKLSVVDLDYIILDTVDFKPDFPKLTIVEQEPKAGAKVKEGRKIYIKINASKYTMVTVPDLIEKTYRQAVPTLKAIGLLEGTITYKPYLGKDMVLELRQNGKKLKAGDKVLKSSKIDLVLGDGKITYEETVDSTAVDSTEIIPLDGQ